MIAANKAISIHSVYKPLYSTKKRYVILTGGRGSGKTFAVMDYVLRLTYEAGRSILYTRYTMTSAEKTIIPLFAKIINSSYTASDFHVTKTAIYNKRTGSFILFSGIKTSSGDQTANLKTLPNIDTWVIEEGEDYNSENSFTDIDDSIRVEGVQNKIIWIQNPSTAEHFIYKRFFEFHHELRYVNGFAYQHSTHPDAEHIHTTYHINRKNLDAAKVEQWDALALTNPKKYQHKYIGSWVDKAEGVIFDRTSVGDFPENLPYCYGQDFGWSVDPTTLVRVAVDKGNKKIYVDEVWYSKGERLGTAEIANRNRQTILRQNDLIIADSHGQQDRIVTEMQRLGLNVLPSTLYSHRVIDGVSAMLDYEIIYTARSVNVRKELSNYTWSDKKAGIPVDDYNHTIDPMRYAFEFLTQKRRTTYK